MRHTDVTVILIAALLVSHTGISAVQAQNLRFSGSVAYGDVLKQMSFGPRIPGSTSLLATADYIRSNLTANGWNLTLQNFTYYNGLLKKNIEAHNIIATLGIPILFLGLGNPPNLVLGAHYDTRPLADGPNSNNTTVPVPGADDGASGVAALLELGRIFGTSSRANAYLTLVFFDGEDSGNYTPPAGWIQGSEHYVHSLNNTQRGQIQAAIILDMVGYSNLVLRREERSDYAISSAIWSQGRELGYTQFAGGVQPSLIDDHSPFLEAGIRAVDIIDFDYPFWHTPYDTADKVSASSLEAVGRTVEAFIRSGAIVNPTLPPSFFIILGALIVVSASAVLLLRRAKMNAASLVRLA